MTVKDAKYGHLETEEISSKFSRLDTKDTKSILKTINDEDKIVPEVISGEIPAIAEIVDSIVNGMRLGGRLIYVGAGTAGRLGILDAAECGPTFGVPQGVVVPVMAGGKSSFVTPSEGVEDNSETGSKDVESLEVGPKDVVLGIVSSGKAPYVIGALKKARELGAKTGAIVNVSNPDVADHCNYLIKLLVGPEVIAGSSRMKAGTSEKLVLNMISTAVFVKLGKIYDNMMVDLKPVNEKLRERMVNVLSRIMGVDDSKAKDALVKAEWNLKAAALMLRRPMELNTAIDTLNRCNGNLRCALEMS